MSIPLNYYTDKEGIEEFSDPKLVQRKAKLYGLDVVFSPRKNKKYRFVNPETNEFVDFGFFGMSDFTKHKNLKRLENFRKRNNKWRNAPKYSAAWASFFLLWD